MMVRRLFKVSLSHYITQRGTGQTIQREEAVVYGFMPVVLGERFRTDDILSRMLLREAPVDGPFMLQTEAYETLGLRYLREGNMIAALECYRIALDSRTSFAGSIADIQEIALLNKKEIQQMTVATDLETKLVAGMVTPNGRTDLAVYTAWVEGLRTAHKHWRELNKRAYGSREYGEACLRIGMYEEAHHVARELRSRSMAQRVRELQPKEILDLRFLRKYIEDNLPESTFGA